MARHSSTGLKVSYTINELAELAGCHRNTMRKRLRAKGVELDRRRISVRVLKVALIDLWLDLEEARAIELAMRD